jgi:Family of unknown function (DUF5684)
MTIQNRLFIVIISLISITKGFSQKPEIIYSNDQLVGISNAVTFNDEIYFVAGLYPDDKFPGYPDRNAKWCRLLLRNESEDVYDFETSSVAARPQETDLQITPEGNIAFIYQVPTGSNYGFKMPYKVFNGDYLVTDELIFNQKNWGTWPRLQYGDNNIPNVVSFAHDGRYLKYHKKPSSSWQSNNIAGPNVYCGDMATTMKNNVFYILGRVGTKGNKRTLKLFSNPDGKWQSEKISTNMDRSCDIEFSNTGVLYALFTQNDNLMVATNSSGKWETERVTSDSFIAHKASIFHSREGDIYIAYQTDNKVVVLTKVNNTWENVYTHKDLFESEYYNWTRQPTLLYKGSKIYLIYTDAKNVYLKKIKDNFKISFGAFAIIYLAIIITMIVSMWKVFEKAGQPGWACLIPIYNIIVLLRIIGKDWTNILWVFLPIIGGIILQVIIVTGVSKSFGKEGSGFGAGLFFLPIIFYPILAFGDAVYTNR